MTFVFNKKKKKLSLFGATELGVCSGGGGGGGGAGGRHCLPKRGREDARARRGQGYSGGALSGLLTSLQTHLDTPSFPHWPLE